MNATDTNDTNMNTNESPPPVPPPPPPPVVPPSQTPVHVHIQPPATEARAPLTVYAVLSGVGSILAIHRSVKAASVDAWTRALTDDGIYRIEGWQVAFGTTVDTLKVAGWTLEIADALAWKRSPGKEAWLKELSDTNRVPKALWGTFMTQY